MKVSHLIMRSQDLFNSEYVTSDINHANQEKWVRAIQILGNRWLLAKTMKKEECTVVRPNLAEETA